MKQETNSFEYNYSAPLQVELQQIREKYLPKEETKLEQLHRLDASTTKKGQAISLSLGVLSVLALGIGMCCTMVWRGALFFPGILIGCIGLLGTVLAYPLYTHVTAQERERLAPEILRLTDELMNN